MIWLITISFSCAPTQQKVVPSARPQQEYTQQKESLSNQPKDSEKYSEKVLEERTKKETEYKARLNGIRGLMNNRGYLSTDELKEVMDIYHQEPGTYMQTSELLAEAVERDRLPFKAMFNHAIEKGNYDEAKRIQKNWIATLNDILKITIFKVHGSENIQGKISLQLKELEDFHFSEVKRAMFGRGYLTVDELQEALDKHNGIILSEALEKDMLPFKAMFYLAIEKENYDEGELIRRAWISNLKNILNLLGSFATERLKTKTQLQIEKLNIVGLTDSILVTLRKELVIAMNDKKWGDAEKIQNIITARVKELTPPPPPPQPQVQVIERVVERPQAAQQGVGGQTTVVVQQPDKIQVEQLPRYGLSDYGRALSIIGGKPISSKDASTLKLFDMIMGR